MKVPEGARIGAEWARDTYIAATAGHDQKKRQEVAKIAEIFLTPINIGQPEILLISQPLS